MSKYTTEVRYICEQAAGLRESASANEIDNVISKSWNKILYTQCEFFDENYRAVLFKKILKHYYLREICSETVGIWKLWMNTRIEEIMPYYNQLYNSALIQFNPLHNTNLSKSSERNINREQENNRDVSGNSRDTENTETTGTDTGTATTTGTEEGTTADSGSASTTSSNTGRTTESGTTSNAETNLYSDTPQGSITGLDNQTYLTNATKDNKSGTSTGTKDETSSGTSSTTTSNSGSTSNESESTTSTTNNSTSETDRTANNTFSRSEDMTDTQETLETYTENIIGNSGQNQSEMLLKFRETLINIDMMVINEFSDLFFNLW